LIAALVLLGPAGWLFDASRSTSGEPEVAPAEPTQVHTGVATPQLRYSHSSISSDEINVDDSVDLRIGDCFDLKHPLAEVEHVKKVRCTAEHDYVLPWAYKSAARLAGSGARNTQTA
jgi:hypothetical protein